MGKYKEQAISYKMGMDMLSTSLMEILEKLKNPDDIVDGEGAITEESSLEGNEINQDPLNYYVKVFNDDMKEAITSLIAKCNALPIIIMQKAEEIDARIELEQQSLIDGQSGSEASEFPTQGAGSIMQSHHEVIRGGRTDAVRKVSW